MATRVVVNPNWFDEAMNRGGATWLDETIGDRILSDSKRLCPKDTHELVQSLGKELVGNDRVDIGSGVGGKKVAQHAVVVEVGGQPHDIPNAFGLGITVHHPGTAAQPYLTPALYRKRRGKGGA